jgi:hypothetical protein
MPRAALQAGAGLDGREMKAGAQLGHSTVRRNRGRHSDVVHALQVDEDVWQVGPSAKEDGDWPMGPARNSIPDLI